MILTTSNEEDIISKKSKNFLRLDHLPENIEPFLGADNSRDRTNEMMNEKNLPNIKPHINAVGRRKTSSLNGLANEAFGEFLYFSDITKSAFFQEIAAGHKKSFQAAKGGNKLKFAKDALRYLRKNGGKLWF